MAGAIVQAPAPVIDDSGANSPTIAFTLTGVTAGNTIAVHVGWGSATETCTVSDGTAYSIADAVRTDGAGQRGQVFYLDNVSAGSHVITATFSATVGFRRIRPVEIAGLVTAGSLDQATGQGQLAPGTGTDAVSSGATSTTTNAADFVLGLTQNSGEISPGSGTVTAGTGFQLGGATSVMMTVESMSVAATGAQTATFTHSVANNRITHVVAFMEAAAGGAAPSAGLRLPTVRPDSRPARSPQTARFHRPPRAFNAVTASPDVTLSLTGQTATFTAGTLTRAIDYAPTGQTATFTSGALAPGVSYALLGQSASFSQGLLSPALAYALTAQTATFTPGALTASLAYALSGQTATFTEGALTTVLTTGLTAQTAIFTTGTLAPAIGYGLTAQTATFSEGIITATQGGDVTRTLSGQTATFSEGSLTASLSYSISGQTATFSEGAMAAALGSALGAQTATFTLGSLTASGGEAATTSQVGAGRARRRRRLMVHIDGQDFEVESLQHAQALLEQAKSMARRLAPQKAEAHLMAHLATTPRIRPKIERPRIHTHTPELHQLVARSREAISELYKAAYRDAEIKLRLAAKISEDDGDDEDLLLML